MIMPLQRYVHIIYLFLFFSIFNLADLVGPWKLTFALGLKFLYQTHMHIASHV